MNIRRLALGMVDRAGLPLSGYFKQIGWRTTGFHPNGIIAAFRDLANLFRRHSGKESLSPDWRKSAAVLGLVRKTLSDSPLWRAREWKTYGGPTGASTIQCIQYPVAVYPLAKRPLESLALSAERLTAGVAL